MNRGKPKPVTDIPNWVYETADRMNLSVWAKVGEGVGKRQGSVHYYNFEDGVSVWTNKFRPEWVKFYDHGKKEYYYANQFTGRCEWEEPATYQKPVNKALMKFLVVNKDLRAALIIQHAFRAQQARRHAFVEIARMHAHKAFVNWVTVTDPTSGCDYYFNILTNAGPLWKKPYSLEKAELETPTWCKIYDPKKTLYYYYNNFTHDVRWSKPEDYRDPPKAALLLGTYMSPEVKSAILIQNAYRARQSRKVALKQRALHDPDGKAVRGWLKEFSSFHNAEYYFHIESGEIVWEKPHEVIEYESNHMPEWVLLYDPSHKKHYFFNNLTFESAWDRPESYFTPRNNSAEFLKNISLNPEVKAALCIQMAWRKRQARALLRIKKATSDSSHAHNGWISETDRKTGLEYYYCVETGEVTWEKPATLGGGRNNSFPEEWIKVWSPPDNKHYYYSNWTLETTWDRPVGYKDPPKGAAALKHFAINKEMKAAMTIQHAYRAKLAREEARRAKAERHGDEAHNGWVEVHDSYSGKDYYWNKGTGEVSWEKPEELGGGSLAGVLEWVKLYSPRDQKDYYYNNFTGDFVWERPLNFEEYSANVQLMTMSKELRSAIKIQQLFRAKLARELLRKKKVERGNGEPFRGWVTEHDSYSGKDYYWHIETREVTWDKPLILTIPKWVQMYDPETKWHYYVNNDTGECVWERPEDYTDPAPGTKFKTICINPEVRAALTIQSAYRGRQAQLLCIALNAKRNGVDEEHGWVVCQTQHGTDFFWRVNTKRVTFRRPRVLGGGETGASNRSQEYTPSPEYAERAMELMHILDNDNYDVMKKVELGALYADDGNYELSVETIKSAQAAGADGHTVYGALGKSYYLLWEQNCDYNNLNMAFACFQKMAQRHMHPRANYLFYMARCYEGFGSYQSAVRLLGDIISEYPDYENILEVIFHAAVILKHLGSYKIAQDYLAFLASTHTQKISSKLIWFQVAHCFYMQGEEELAQEGLDYLFHRNKKEMKKMGFSNGTQWAQAPKTWLGIGFAMKEHHLHLMASDCFKHAIARIQKKEDLSPEVYLALSHCLHRSHNRKEALAVLESAVLLFEEDPAIMEAYEKLNEEYAAKVKAEAAAALLISRVIRGRIARKRLAKIKNKIRMIEEAKVADSLRRIFHKKSNKIFLAWKNHVEYVLAIRHFGEKLVGKGLRRHFAAWVHVLPKLTRENLVRILKAGMIQRAFRAYMVRTILERAVRRRRKNDQIVTNARKVREHRITREILNRWLQYSHKCENARKFYSRLKHRELLGVFNQWVSETELQVEVKAHAATQIQSCARRWMAQRELQRMKDARDFLIRMIQAKIRAKLARIKAKVAAWKKKVAYTKLAVKIQATWRGYSTRGEIWGKWTHASILIQALWRNYAWRKERKSAARIIQRAWDRYRFNKTLYEHYCAMKIEALYRGHLARRWVKMNVAATQITKVYRSHMARSNVKTIKKRLHKFWANILFEEIDAQTPVKRMDKGISPLKKKMLRKSGELVPPDTSRALYEGSRLSQEVWKRFSCENVHLISRVKPVKMPVLIPTYSIPNQKTRKVWQDNLPTPQYPYDDAARIPYALPKIQSATKSPAKPIWQNIQKLKEENFSSNSPIQAMYLVPKTPEVNASKLKSKSKKNTSIHALPGLGKSPEYSTNGFVGKSLRERKRLLPMAHKSTVSPSYTSSAIINSGDVALLSSFAKLRSNFASRSTGNHNGNRRNRRRGRRR